ncbi:hypothetical protein KG089_04840 [Carnobacteriaceae bacterium zg-ZUI252]|nr:hypothetical protein [Carnobacteriaceae bacterium zg-ZUI252]MBS4770139.1 hypothetical protein [Carnobacteriaceae bacterium zg-ZUI240]QTU82733.1 hypothetical protein J7S27_05540 [Carnobacteriaceae bacterium zg-C25]
MKIDRLSIWFLLKAREFHKLGYTHVSAKQIRDYCERFLWKRNKPDTYKQLKSAIQHITPNQFFDYQTLLIQMNQDNDVSSIDFSQLD